MSDVVWICEKNGVRWIQDDTVNADRHILKGWDHSLLCGYYQLVPVESA